MPDLTLQQRFGTNVSFNASSKTLTINLNDLTDSGDIKEGLGLDISALTASNINSYAAKIFYEIILLNFQKQPVTNNDDSVAVYISNSGRREVVRNSQSQLSYILSVGLYTPNNLASILDPDLLV